jgi:hypothetical protein
MARDPDILLRILLGAIERQEDQRYVLDLLGELRLAIMAHQALPQRTALLDSLLVLLRQSRRLSGAAARGDSSEPLFV